jgi:hypothetical protein
MAGLFSRSTLVLCLTCWAVSAQAADPPAVRTESQLKSVLASGQATPLDLLTPYGKRRFLQGIVWREAGMGGFSGTQLVRELDAAQIAQVLAFFGLQRYTSTFTANLAGAPLRLAPSPALETQLDRFERLARTVAEERAEAEDATSVMGAKRLASHYDEVFASRMMPAALRSASLGDLSALFDAAALASDVNPDSAATAHLLAVHGELAARGIDTRRTLDDSVQSTLLAARRFADARTFAMTRPHLGRRDIPSVVDTLGAGFSGRSLYDYDAGKNQLTRRAAPPPTGQELVMVVGSGCHFSRDALAALRADPALLARLRQANLTLVTPPRAPIPFRYLAEWNAANPTLPLRVPYNASEWETIAEAGTPEFFVFRDGKLAGHLIGWPRGGNAAALLALLDGAVPKP